MDLDKKSLANLKRNLLKSMNKSIQVGWFEGVNTSPIVDTRYDNAAWVASLMYHGDEDMGIPPRPFFDHLSTIRRPDTEAILKGVATAVKQGDQGLQQAMADKAGRLVSDIIDDFNSPANTKATQKKKGFNNPLIETGNLMETVKGRIV